MSTFAQIRGPRYVLPHVRVPACLLSPNLQVTPVEDDLCAVDILVANGEIEQVSVAGECAFTESAQQPIVTNVAHCIALPCFVDAHTHLDKGHIWPRQPNPDGSFGGALTAVETDRSANWSAEDLYARMDFSLRCAWAHGTAALRTHLDSIGEQVAISWPVFAEMRERWAGRVDLQAVSLTGLECVAEPQFSNTIVPAVARHGGVLGVVTYPLPQSQSLLRRLFEVAIEHGLALDLHCDESGDPAADTLRQVAEIAMEFRFELPIVAGHCCSLAVQSEREVKRTLDTVARAGIAMISLPMCNLYLQARQAAQTPRWRGLTVVHEARARGIPVCFASDNTRDPFYAYGDLDMLEVLRESVRVAHLDHPIDDWLSAFSLTPAQVLGFNGVGRIVPGVTADLVLCRARRYTELLSRPQADRIVVRAGQTINTTLPDYRELDPLFVCKGDT